jgi:hypothetical protein
MSDLTFKDIVEEADGSLEKALKNLVSAKIAAAAQSAGEPGKGLFFPDGIQLIYLSFNVKNIGEVTLAIAGEKAKYPNQPNQGSVLRESDGSIGILTTRRLNLVLTNFTKSLAPRAKVNATSKVSIDITCGATWKVSADDDKIFHTKEGKHGGEQFSDHQGRRVLTIPSFDCCSANLDQVFNIVNLEPGQNSGYMHCKAQVKAIFPGSCP